MIVETSAIVAKGLGIRRGGRWLLRPASFGIPGGVIGIAGPAGSGKSVLLATLATLRRPQAGTVELFGAPVTNRAALRHARSRIGFLPSNARWAGGSTVHDLVSYAAYYQRRPATTVQRVLDNLGLSDVAGWQLTELPADLRIRAGLAGACVHSPDLAFLDEPLSGLSPHAVRELIPLLGSVAPTIVITAASAAELGWCDRVYVLEAGRLSPAGVAAQRMGQPSPAPSSRSMPHIAAAWTRELLAHA